MTVLHLHPVSRPSEPCWACGDLSCKANVIGRIIAVNAASPGGCEVRAAGRKKRPPGSKHLDPCLNAVAFDFCIPTRGTKVPSAPDWLHEIKYDGYRLRVERDGDRVRLITRNGYDWTGAISLDSGIRAQEQDQAVRRRW
jgi:hypothetical protein